MGWRWKETWLIIGDDGNENAKGKSKKMEMAVKEGATATNIFLVD